MAYTYRPRKGVPAFQKRCDAIHAEIDIIAEEIFEKYIKPFCDKYGYAFDSGMGSWSVYSRGKDLDEAALPRWFRDLLNWDVDGLIRVPIAAWTHYDYESPTYDNCRGNAKDVQLPFRLVCEQAMENQLAHVIYEEYKNKRTEDLLIAEKVARRRGFSEQAIEEFRGGKLPEGALPSKFYPRELR